MVLHRRDVPLMPGITIAPRLMYLTHSFDWEKILVMSKKFAKRQLFWTETSSCLNAMIAEN